ncbi:hypothetical protein DBIPINDM_001871 [Mesorhizobium sp. AR02]|uniref:hypothetical protein n=1 Tax=Mesorhizobium sp. AR02 TaxID=2865837 RepID=UPI00215E3621|nr:hypothetical protein [Mesorhizobium sp. AR02]UVK55363.1 hypothetical protein DBIPINDM_001871 [Mesorhizobium sp. AR02]
MADIDLLKLVWGETSEVTPRDGAVQTVKRLHAVVAKLAALAKKRGLEKGLRSIEPPRVGTPEAARFQAMSATVDEVGAGIYGGAALPARAALLEVSATGAPRLETALPTAASWILDSGVASGGEFVVGDGSDGRIFRLFESDKVPAEDELPFVSGVTGSGLPEPIIPNPYRTLAWYVGIAAAIIFVMGATVSVWSGRSMSGARNILQATNPAIQYGLIAKVANLCAEDFKAFPNGMQAAVCAKVLDKDKVPELDKTTNRIAWPDQAKAGSVLDDAKACPADPSRDGCNTIWRAAVALDQDETWKASVFTFAHTFSTYVTGTDPAYGSTSIVFPFLLLVSGIAGLTVALGLGTKQRVAGVWIDTRNRVSLARAQVTLWTAVALAGYAAFALFNIGFAGIVGAGDIASFAAFPAIPASVAAALGIAAVSPMISALILPTKDSAGKNVDFDVRGADSDLRRRGAPFFGAESQGLDRRGSPALASIADIFMGEENANVDTVDVSRLQNVVITVTLVLGFFSLLIEMTSSITTTTMLGAKGAVFTSLPELGATFTSLLFVSHATYLVAKAHDARSLGTGGTSD